MTFWKDIIVEAYPAGIAGGPIDITSQVVLDYFTTTAPGGDGELAFTRTVASDRDSNTFDTPYGGLLRDGVRVILRDGPVDAGGVFWVGRVERPTGDFWRGGATLQTICRGYASSGRDHVVSSRRTWGAGWNVMAIYADSLEFLCPDITDPGLRSNAEMFNMGRVLQEESRDWCLAHAQDIWNNCASVSPGAGVGVPLLWRVMNVDSLGFYWGITPVMNVKPRPGLGEITYRTRMAPALGHRGGTRVQAAGDLQNIYNQVVIKVDNPDKEQPYIVVIEPQGEPYGATENGVRTRRMLGLDMQGLGNGELPEDIAAATAEVIRRARLLANMMLAQAVQTQATNGSVRMVYPQTALDRFGVQVPLHRIRAGEVIEVEDWRPREVFFTDTVPNAMTEMYIVGTRHDKRGVTMQIGVRSDLTESIGRALKSKEQGRSDYSKSGVTPQVGRLVQIAGHTDTVPFAGATNIEAPYSNVLHVHGTPNGDISITANFDNADGTDEPPALPVGAKARLGLIRGTWTRCVIACDSGAIKFHVDMPAGIWRRFDESRQGPIEPSSFDVEGGNGTEHLFVQECQTGKIATVTIAANPSGLSSAALVFFGARNLLVHDPSPSVRKKGVDV